MRCAVHTADSCLKISVVLSFENAPRYGMFRARDPAIRTPERTDCGLRAPFNRRCQKNTSHPKMGWDFIGLCGFSYWKNVQRYGSSAPMILGFTRRGVRIADYGHCSTPVARNKPVRWISLDWDGKFCQVPGRWSARSKGNQRQSAGIAGWGRSDPVPSRKKRGRA